MRILFILVFIVCSSTSAVEYKRDRDRDLFFVVDSNKLEPRCMKTTAFTLYRYYERKNILAYFDSFRSPVTGNLWFQITYQDTKYESEQIFTRLIDCRMDVAQRKAEARPVHNVL